MDTEHKMKKVIFSLDKKNRKNKDYSKTFNIKNKTNKRMKTKI